MSCTDLLIMSDVEYPLMPYWLIPCWACLFALNNVLFGKCGWCGKTEDILTDFEKGRDVSPKILLGLGCGWVVYFVYICLHVFQFDAGHYDSTWDQYQALYLMYINAALPVYIVSFWWYIMNRQRDGHPDYVSDDDAFCWSIVSTGGGVPMVAAYCTILPAVVTHIFPMVVCYIWLVLPLGGTLAHFFMCLFKEKADIEDPSASRIVTRTRYGSCLGQLGYVAFISFFTAVVSFFTQTLFNYAVLFYQKAPLGSLISGSDYIAVITEEFNARNTHCWLTAFGDDISNKGQWSGEFSGEIWAGLVTWAGVPAAYMLVSLVSVIISCTGLACYCCRGSVIPSVDDDITDDDL